VSTEGPVRLTVVLTHPVQYFSPWFRYIHAHAPSIALTVVYATRLTPTQQGAGFGLAFEWDVPLLDGYRSRVVQQAHPGDALADASGAIDAPDIGRVIAETDPGAVLIPGWHARVYGRALAECRARKIPTLYRGDTNLLTTHRGLGRLAWRARTRRRLEKFDAYLAVGTRSRQLFAEFEQNPAAHIDEYSQANMAFHKAIIRMGGCALMSELTDSLFIHMRAVRAVTMRQDNRAERSIIDHLNIIAALEKRDADLAERLVREHTLGLADHVEKHGEFLDRLHEGSGGGRKSRFG